MAHPLITRYVIVGIGKNDGYFKRRSALIGKVGRFNKQNVWKNGYSSGEFLLDVHIEDYCGGYSKLYFHQLKVVELKD